MRRLLAAAAIIVAGSAVARAEDVVVHHARVVLVSMPDAIFAATAASLGPWSIAVEATAEPPPVDDAAARALADAHGATAVAWIDGAELVLFDALAGTTTRQPMPAVIDDASAASVALTLKTALRKPVTVTRAPDPPPPPPPVIVEPTPAPRGGVIARGGIDVGVRSGDPAMLRFGARASVEPRAWRGVGIALGVELGPSSTEAVGMSFRDRSAHAGLEWHRAIGSRHSLVPSVGVSLHQTRIVGSVMESRIHETDLGVSADVALAVEHDGRVRKGLVVTASWFTRRVRYQLDGEDVAALPTVSVGIALRLGL